MTMSVLSFLFPSLLCAWEFFVAGGWKCWFFFYFYAVLKVWWQSCCIHISPAFSLSLCPKICQCQIWLGKCSICDKAQFVHFAKRDSLCVTSPNRLFWSNTCAQLSCRACWNCGWAPHRCKLSCKAYSVLWKYVCIAGSPGESEDMGAASHMVPFC